MPPEPDNTMNTKTESKHTPGPWTSDPEGEVAVTIEDANGNPIADVYGSADDNPNAALMAASPALLDALRLGLLLIERIEPNDTLDEHEKAFADAARYAITKATQP